VKIAHVASEVAPWSQTGGLADVVGALPTALERTGQAECAVFSPLYRGMRQRIEAQGASLDESGLTVTVPLAGRQLSARFLRVRRADAAPVYLLDYPALYDRDGLYMGADGRDHPDNHLRFALLCRAALEAAPRLMDGIPDVFHAHDWHAGLVPVYLRTRYRRGHPAAVFTIHNLAYQGVFHKDVLPALSLDWSVFTPARMEYYDNLSLLKGGVAYADAVTTVSPSYAYEVRTPRFGHNLDGFLRNQARNFHGILNGIDAGSWDPARDRAIAANYDRDTLDRGKVLCRRALAQEFGLTIGDRELLLAVVSRFTGQKGIDLVADLVPYLAELGARLVVLGSGETGLEERFRYLARVFSRHVAVRIGFDVPLSRRVYSGADAVLVPSRFEPCGLTQMYAMRYGSVPIVHAVGGLRDTVLDPGDPALCRGQGTGFCFEHPTVQGLGWAVGRAARIFRESPEGWQRICRSGMQCDWSWDEPAREYMRLYRRLL
jgi:starch synthase